MRQNYASPVLFSLVVLLLFTFALPGGSEAREAGWVPLEQSRGRNLSVPLKRNEPVKNKKTQAKKRVVSEKTASVYENQPPVTEVELKSFVLLLPRFRKWARTNGEDAHPIVNSKGEPDFQYSAKAAQWVLEHDFDPLRFFCVMGRLAAGLVVVEEGNDYHGTRPADMPGVTAQELGLVRKHLGELLAAGGQPTPLKAD